ncbi:MAG: O-antigen ligase family protein [Candidatus Sungbacteria bacterium]|nr:O-antigen ligase family protein [Candidatus Sungbacteria bacterium]
MKLKPQEQFFLWIVKIGLWVIPFLPLYVSSSMLFPFITGKNFAFRITVEFIFIFWVFLAMVRSEFRPRLTPLFKAATIFIVILFLADLFSPNPYRAFFSNYERMEGFMMLFHLYIYFVMLASVFKTRRDWLIFFHSTLIASLIVSYIALTQRLGYRISLQGGFRVDSTIGNPTYLAAYLVFHIWLLFILLYQFWKKWWLSALYGAALIFELIIIYFTATRGATLAIAGALIFLSIASVVFWKKMFPAVSQMRKWAGAVLFTVAAIPFIFWFARESDFVRSSPVLSRLTSYSFQERTIQSRFMIWRMSSKAVLERPIFGWGQENYYLVFQKYFDPRLYQQEPWFDRSHNVFFDWLIHAGFLGLLSYLSLIGVSLWLIFHSLQKGNVAPFEGLIISALFLTYFLQNIFVFDNLNTYLLFFSFLAYTEVLTAPREAVTAPAALKEKLRHDKTHPGAVRGAASHPVSAGLAYAVLVAFIAFFLIGGYQFHAKPVLESKGLIVALQSYQAQRPMDEVIQYFKNALAYNTFGDTEVREQLSNLARGVIGHSKYTEDEHKKMIDFSVEELRREASIPAPDVKHKLFLGALMSRAARLNPQYAVEAENALKEAIGLSPGKQIIYFELAQVYLNQGRIDETVKVLQQVLDLEPSYQDAAVNLLAVGYMAKRADAVEKAKTYFRQDIMAVETVERLAGLYQQAGDFVSARTLYEELILRYPDNAKYHALLASLLAFFGEKERAIAEAETAARLDPGLAKEVEGFLKQLQGGSQ